MVNSYELEGLGPMVQGLGLKSEIEPPKGHTTVAVLLAGLLWGLKTNLGAYLDLQE